MNDFEYQMILLDGFVNHRDFLKNHLHRELIKALEREIPFEEFFGRCKNVVTYWETILDNQIHERKRELYTIIRTTDVEQTKAQCRDEINTISRSNYSVNLLHTSNNHFSGQLWYDDILVIETAVNELISAHDSKHLNKQKRISLSESEINNYRNVLLNECVLVAEGENPNSIGKEKLSASQIIGLVIKEISSSKNIPQQKVFEQVKQIWKLTKKELKNYKVPNEDNPKFGDYEGFVDSVLTKVEPP